MASYCVKDLVTGETRQRPTTWSNPHEVTSPIRWQNYKVDPTVEAFHRTLPDYAETKLHNLKSLAAELGLHSVFIKDESTRFGLPSFKILGASWAIHRAICQHLDLPAESSLVDVRQVLNGRADSGSPVRLVTCTEGNWGRASARMAKHLGIEITVYVPGFMSTYTQQLLKEEFADMIVLQDGSYDDCIAATRDDAKRSGALMVMDTSWDGYEEIPQWVTDGYTTMLTETDRQVAALTDGRAANTFFVAVGVGSWAHAVASHYKATNPENHIISVEPTVAASLKESLHCNTITPIATGHTIMAGMCCGTTSKIAFPVLKDAVTSAVTVTDRESHESVLFLQDRGVNAGPCGAATVSALRKYVESINEAERGKMVVVLFSTEGWREYQIPT